MFRFRKNRQQNKQDDIENVMNEVSNELGVDLDTQSIDEDPKQLAERMKQEIKKRT